MKLNFLRWSIAIEPRKKSLANLTPEEVQRIATGYSTYGYSDIAIKICRIKAVRYLAPGTGLTDAKNWVEEKFCD